MGDVPNTLTGSNNGVNGIVLDADLGDSGSDQAWTWGHNIGFPVVVEEVQVAADDSLTIESGSVVKFLDSGSFLEVLGVLEVPSAGETTWFTSLADDARGGDTNNDGSASHPFPGDWRGLALRSDANLYLHDTWFAYAGDGSRGSIHTTSGRNGEILWDGGGAAVSEGDGARLIAERVEISGVQFLSNEGDGLEINVTEVGVATNCEFVGNTNLTVNNANTFLVDATNS